MNINYKIFIFIKLCTLERLIYEVEIYSESSQKTMNNLYVIK